ncbi:MAG: hypothetical protein M3Z16_04055 [Pseudomonadota bacterium]|nr:hypothetical protein [Pseudomonadota bacterium]
MKTLSTAVITACFMTFAGSALAADDMKKGDAMMKKDMTMQECKDHMAMSKKDAGMKKDDAMMKKDTMCHDMMKKSGMAASEPMMKK